MSGIGPITNDLLGAQLTGAAIRDKIATKVAAKALDAVRDEGAAMLELLDGAVQMADQGSADPLGQNLDLRA